MSSVIALPDLVPVLSRGRHRNPRRGACFMEMASYLAGEKWSDHPTCTHPLLAHLARCVNDSVTDETRRRLAPMIPDVVGLATDDPRVTARLALHSALAALPIAPAARQNVLAVGALTCEKVLADLEGRDAEGLTPTTSEVLARVPDAARWARKYVRPGRIPDRMFTRRTAPHLVGYAVEGIALACVNDSQDRLVALLQQGIDEVRHTVVPQERAQIPATDSPVRLHRVEVRQHP